MRRIIFHPHRGSSVSLVPEFEDRQPVRVIEREGHSLFAIPSRLLTNGPSLWTPFPSASSPSSSPSPSWVPFSLLSSGSRSLTPSGMSHPCATAFAPSLPSRMKLHVVVKMHLPFCLACTVLVTKLFPSRTRSTWYRMGIVPSPASTK